MYHLHMSCRIMRIFHSLEYGIRFVDARKQNFAEKCLSRRQFIILVPRVTAICGRFVLGLHPQLCERMWVKNE